MVKCNKCDKEIESDDNFCDKCGAPQNPMNPQVQQPQVQQPQVQQPQVQQSMQQQPMQQQPMQQQPMQQQPMQQQPMQQPMQQQPMQPQQPFVDNLKNKINKINPFSKKTDNQKKIQQQPNQQQTIAQQPIQQNVPSVGKIILPDQSAISINQLEKQFGREDFIRNVTEDLFKYISRKHFKIFNENGTFYIEDSNSANGTKLNGIEIKNQGKKQLKNGDKLSLGDSLELVFNI